MENHQPRQEQLYFLNDQGDEHDNIDPKIPPGYRFVPYDVELIDDYLRKIVSKPGLNGVHGIYAVNLYGSGPDELTAAHKEQCENAWYFFTQRNRKYANGNRPDRSAGNGYWKQTNVVHPIFRLVNGEVVKIGRKITLDYYSKSNNTDQGGIGGTHTDWKMHEYRLDDEKLPQNSSSSAGTTDDEFYEWCLCRVYKSAKKRNDDGQVTLQVARAPRSNTHLIAPQQHTEHFAGKRATNFTGQRTGASSFGDQHIIANGHNAGGPGLNFVQQSTNLQFSSNFFWNPNNSNYMANATSGSMNGMHYNTNNPLINRQDMYPISGRMHENAGYAQPIRSLAPGGVPMWSHSDTNQSSLSIPDHVPIDREYEFPPLSFPGNGESSPDIEFSFDDFDELGNQDD